MAGLSVDVAPARRGPDQRAALNGLRAIVRAAVRACNAKKTKPRAR